MAIIGHSRGHEIVYIRDKQEWIYTNNGEKHDNSEPRRCKRCGQYPTEEGHDSCLGHLEGVKYACCGHGIPGMAYVVLEDGTRIPELVRGQKKSREERQKEFDEWYANYLKEHGGTESD
jgi:hypothetical protein